MDMDYEENIVAEGTEEFVVDADKQAKFMESSKERMNKICIQLAYLEKIATKRSVDYTPDNIEKMFAYMEERLASCKKALWQDLKNPKRLLFLISTFDCFRSYSEIYRVDTKNRDRWEIVTSKRYSRAFSNRIHSDLCSEKYDLSFL